MKRGQVRLPLKQMDQTFLISGQVQILRGSLPQSLQALKMLNTWPIMEILMEEYLKV
jgi:hypothetical protein